MQDIYKNLIEDLSTLEIKYLSLNDINQVEEEDNTKAIYAWYVVPNDKNLKPFSDFFSLSDKRQITGKDFFSKNDYVVKINGTKKGNEASENIRINFDTWTCLHIFINLMPPVYIGYSEHLYERLYDHKEELIPYLQNHVRVDKNEDNFSDNAAKEFANTFASKIELIFGESFTPSLSSLFIKAFIFKDQNISKSRIVEIEKYLINTLVPIGNTRI